MQPVTEDNITELAAECRFRDCNHENEPGCAVLAAVEEGRISPVRLQSYRTLIEETRRNARLSERQRWTRRR